MPDWTPADLIPGIFFGALAVLLFRSLRRWYDPVPLRAAAAFLLVLAVLFGPVLFGGKLLLPLDSLRGEVPFRELPPAEVRGNFLQGDLLQLVAPSALAVREALAEGRWPLWNPRAGGGMPLLADPQAQAFQPLVLLAYPLPYSRAAGVTAALRVLAALAFTFLLLSRQGLHAGPALGGSLAFGLGGFVLLWLGWPLANSAALLPVLLYALVRLEGEGGRRDALLLALATFSLLLGGHPETIGYVLALGTVLFLDLVRRRPPGRRLPLLRQAALAGGLGALAAAPALLPLIEYLPQTLRAVRLAEAAEAARAAPLLERAAGRWLPVAAPSAFGDSRFLDYWGPVNTNEDAGGFVGTAALLLALLAVGSRRPFPQERLMLAAAGVCLVLVLFPAGFLTSRLLLIVGFGLAYGAACTLERLREGRTSRAAALLLALLLAALLVWAYLAHPAPDDPRRLAVFRDGWLRWQLRFLAGAAAVLLLGRGWRWAAPAASFLIAAELLLAHGPANPPMPRRLDLPAVPALGFLEARLGADRTAALGRAFPPNLPSLWGLADARIYNPMAPRAWVEATAPVTVAWGGEVPQWGRPAHPLYPRLGVRFVMIAPEEPCPPPLATAFAGGSARVCEVPAPRPRLFLAGPGAPGLALSLSSQRIAARLPAAAREDEALASNLYQDGGWRLLADGRPIPAGREGPFLAARLPAGTRRLDLLYRPAAFLPGCLLAALAAAASLASWVPPPPRSTMAP